MMSTAGCAMGAAYMQQAGNALLTGAGAKTRSFAFTIAVFPFPTRSLFLSHP
jgi:hypothetical protein